ncbi:hypothetical protein CR513_16672, partial [Mucuna pruriens]
MARSMCIQQAHPHVKKKDDVPQENKFLLSDIESKVYLKSKASEDAILISSYLTNRMPSSMLNDQIFIPSYSLMNHCTSFPCVFGCTYFVHMTYP